MLDSLLQYWTTPTFQRQKMKVGKGWEDGGAAGFDPLTQSLCSTAWQAPDDTFKPQSAVDHANRAQTLSKILFTGN